jgi:hypothetical protein
MEFGETLTAEPLLVRLPSPWPSFASPMPALPATMVTLRETSSILALQGKKHFQEPTRTGKLKIPMPSRKASGPLEIGSWLNSALGHPQHLQAQHLQAHLLPVLRGRRLPRGLHHQGRQLVTGDETCALRKQYISETTGRISEGTFILQSI